MNIKDKIAVVMKEYNASANLWMPKTAAELKDKQIDNALKSFAAGCNKNHISALVDTTALKNGKEGFLFSDEGVYSTYFGKEIGQYISYKDIKAVREAEKKDQIHFEFTDGTEKEVSVSSAVRDDVQNTIRNILELLKDEEKPAQRYSNISEILDEECWRRRADAVAGEKQPRNTPKKDVPVKTKPAPKAKVDRKAVVAERKAAEAAAKAEAERKAAQAEAERKAAEAAAKTEADRKAAEAARVKTEADAKRLLQREYEELLRKYNGTLSWDLFEDAFGDYRNIHSEYEEGVWFYGQGKYEEALKKFDRTQGLQNLFNMGVMYRFGIGTEPDRDKALYYFEIFLRFLDGALYCKNDVKDMAFELAAGIVMEQAAEKRENEADALFDHGNELRNRTDNPDRYTAYRYYEKAAEKGSPEAMWNCGVLCMQGQGTVPEYDKCLKYLTMAENAGMKDSKKAIAYVKSHKRKLLKHQPIL